MKNLNKKNGFSFKVRTKSLTILLVTFLLSAFVGTLFVGEGSADIGYTEYTGTLDGADWALRIPEPRNGMLVVICRGGFTTVNPVSTLTMFSSSMLNQGFAVAASNYGAAGFPVAEGVESTYQLTNYIIENYGVTGRVFLYGFSLGGGVALLLGEKYPDIYSGVLDAWGIKDMKHLYTHAATWANMTDEELTAELTALGTPVPPPGYATLQEFRNGLVLLVSLYETICGGTPWANPTGYEALSPTYHANIQIPVITVHGTADPHVPYVQSLLYQTVIAKAYRQDLYRLYPVLGGLHGSADVLAEIPAHFNELVEWSNELTGSSDWSMFGHDPQCCGYSTSNAPNTNFTLWTYEMNGGAMSSPAVVDGKVYIGSNDKNIYCLDAATGTKIWNYTTTGAIWASSPAVAEGKVYVGSQDKNIYCLDALTGAFIWSYTTGDWVSSPTVANGKVYVPSDDGKLYCLRADWGQVEWKFTTGGEVVGGPAVAYGKAYFGSLDRKVYCVGASTGALIWSYTTGDSVWSSPVVAYGKVYVGAYDNNVYCLDAATGALIWSYTTGDSVRNSPAVAYGKVYVGSHDDNVYCLDANTGAFVWNYTTGGNVWDSPAVADGKVYMGSHDKNIYCLDALTGAFIWSFTTGDAVMSSPAVANGVLYIGTSTADARVLAFSPWAPVAEGLTIGVMLLLSTIAVIVSIRYYRKRPKWQNW